MNSRKKYTAMSLVLLALSLIFLGVSLARKRFSSDTESVVRRVQRTLSSRMAELDSYARKVLEAQPGEWPEADKVPEDMVIYRYDEGELSAWVHRFPTSNDKLGGGLMFQSLVNPDSGYGSALSRIGEEYSYCSIGPKWYVAKAVGRGDVKVITGLEIISIRDNADFSGVNPRLHLPGNYSVLELGASAGAEVLADGTPMFKILYDPLFAASPVSMPYLWTALLLFLAAALLFLLAEPGPRNLAVELLSCFAVLLAFYFSGARVSVNSGLFSPLLYADGRILYSLGALILLSLMLLMPVWSISIVRRRGEAKFLKWIQPPLALALAAFSFVIIRSVSLNSNINLEIYRINDFAAESVLVYLLLILLLSGIPMLLRLLSVRSRIVFSALAAIYLVALSALFGFRKEAASMEVSANRLSVTRDINLEMQLRVVEEEIARDPVIASLAVLPGAGSNITKRISDNYLSRIPQEYDLLVGLGADIDLAAIRGGEYISQGSRFVFKEGADGLVIYSAVFSYSIKNYGIVNMQLRLERKGTRSYRGYAGIFGETTPGEVLIPAGYAYARYQDRNLLTYKGNYAYPVRMDDALYKIVYAAERGQSESGGFTHFYYVVSEGEAVIISRKSVSAVFFAVSVIFIGLLCFLILSISAPRRTRPDIGKKYFSTRLNWLITMSFTLALVCMSAASLYFVYDRNEQNRRTLMTEKINSIAASISAKIRGARSSEDLRSGDVLALIENVSGNTDSDITLYGSDGLVLMSTAPSVFGRNLLDSRIDGNAYRGIMLLTRRYFIQKERAGGHKFYSMYAPLVGEDGNIIAIICAPYTDDTYDFETTAANHAISILSVFLFLLLVAGFLTRQVLERIFQPLLGIGRRMEAADLDSLEYIQYDKQDEISSLVNAYNRMVSDLSESSRKLAEAERDKAWSGMARQVAHEIKNPLTPMKLQIQRLVRLKDRGDALWQEKFDEVTKVLLDHIEILTETANEFSTFAKLYTEEPAEINLGKLLQEEIAMFSGREDIEFEYIGFDSAVVMGPKPQLTRVFVNLLNNSVQALEGVAGAKVRVSLRNSVQDGFYDIVFEDNGAGVSEENTTKLFTPNFTTKTGGSGLGLAISRSILSSCGAGIGYSKSFALGGACFTILYPKNKTISE